MNSPTDGASVVAVVKHLIWRTGGRRINFSLVEADLRKLPEQTVLKIQTLMYFGRGDDSNLRRLQASLLEDTEDKSDAIETICGKLLYLSEYLTRALEKAQKRQIDLDDESPWTVRGARRSLP